MTIHVFENIISPTMQNIIKSEIFSLGFPWVLLDNITYSENSGDTAYGLNHVFYKKETHFTQPIFPYLLPILTECVERTHLEYKTEDILAGRIFMQLPRGTQTQNEPHIDTPIPHWVFLYYVNDSDGDTVLFEKMSPWNTSTEYGETVFTEVKRITPKQGTCVVFDGSIFHASCSPTAIKRCVVNFNYKK